MKKNENFNNKNILFEIIILSFIFVFFLFSNCLTSSFSPTIWIDEVMFADPAINLFFGKGFTSTAWSVQHSHELFAGNSPLYSLLLYPWISIFGISPGALRSINYILMILTALCLWRIVINFDLIKSSNFRLFFIILLLTGNGITFSYRSGRYDCLGIFLLSIFILVIAEYRRKISRNIALIAISILFPLTGLQLCAYVVLFGIFLLLFMGKNFLLEFFIAIFGIFIGSLSLYLFYSFNNVWNEFLASVFSLSSVKLSLLEKVIFIIENLTTAIKYDPSSLILLTLLISITIYQLFHNQFQLRSAYSFGILFTFWIIVGMFIAGAYRVYYSWMIFIPLCICTFSSLDDFREDNKYGWLSIFGTLLISLACLIGLPLRLTATISEWNIRDYSPVIQLVTSNIDKRDIVYCDFQAYYPTKFNASEVYLPTYHLSEQEAKTISVLIINPDSLGNTTKLLGGIWLPGEKLTPPKYSGDFLGFKRLGTTQPYSLQVFRKS